MNLSNKTQVKPAISVAENNLVPLPHSVDTHSENIF